MHHYVHVGMIKDPSSRSVMVVAITTNILLQMGIFHMCSLRGWRRFWSLLIIETWPQLIWRACIGELQMTRWHFRKAFTTLTLWHAALQLRRRGTLPKGVHHLVLIHWGLRSLTTMGEHSFIVFLANTPLWGFEKCVWSVPYVDLRSKSCMAVLITVCMELSSAFIAGGSYVLCFWRSIEIVLWFSFP